jgi:hypothetical protein
MGNAVAEKSGITVAQLEDKRKEYDGERRSMWEDRMPQLKKSKDPVSDVLSLTYGSMSVHDQLLCATNSKVDAEYCVKVLWKASKDPKLSKKDRDAMETLAKEFGKMAEHDVIFEEMYIAVDLAKAGRKEDAMKIIKEIGLRVKKMADFYMEDMEKKVTGDLPSYIVDPQISKSLIAWNTIKREVDLVRTTFKNADVPAGLFESFGTRNALHDATQILASVRCYEEEFAIAYARKAGVFKEVEWKDIYDRYFERRDAQEIPRKL